MIVESLQGNATEFGDSRQFRECHCNLQYRQVGHCPVSSPSRVKRGLGKHVRAACDEVKYDAADTWVEFRVRPVCRPELDQNRNTCCNGMIVPHRPAVDSLRGFILGKADDDVARLPKKLLTLGHSVRVEENIRRRKRCHRQLDSRQSVFEVVGSERQSNRR